MQFRNSADAVTETTTSSTMTPRPKSPCSSSIRCTPTGITAAPPRKVSRATPSVGSPPRPLWVISGMDGCSAAAPMHAYATSQPAKNTWPYVKVPVSVVAA
jgi:hypothetical protein